MNFWPKKQKNILIFIKKISILYAYHSNKSPLTYWLFIWSTMSVIFFTNQHFITDWFVHTGVITYKWICRSFFSSIKIMLMKNMKLTKWHKFVVCKISCFAKCEILPKVCEISPKLRNTPKIANYKVMSLRQFLDLLQHNFNWKKKYQHIHL